MFSVDDACIKASFSSIPVPWEGSGVLVEGLKAAFGCIFTVVSFNLLSIFDFAMPSSSFFNFSRLLADWLFVVPFSTLELYSSKPDGDETVIAVLGFFISPRGTSLFLKLSPNSGLYCTAVVLNIFLKREVSVTIFPVLKPASATVATTATFIKNGFLLLSSVTKYLDVKSVFIASALLIIPFIMMFKSSENVEYI